MLQLFAGMTPGGGVEDTWERILELPTSLAIPGDFHHTFLFWLDTQVTRWLIVMSTAHFFQAQNIAAQLSTAPALWLLNVVPSLCGSSMRDLESSLMNKWRKKHLFLRCMFKYQLMNFFCFLENLTPCSSVLPHYNIKKNWLRNHTFYW